MTSTDKFVVGFLAIVGLIGTIFGLALLMTFPLKWMVNYVFTDSFRLSLFGVAQIGVWRAFWLSALCSLLFKSSTSKSSD